LHQPEFDVWNWSGDADLIEFIKIAQEEDLFVLLKPGPYICAERDFGGFPYWLLNRVPDIQLRTNDLRYLKYVKLYLTTLINKIKSYLRGNGGPIIMVQIENEYGNYKACDSIYMNKLYAIFDLLIGEEAVLYTANGNSDRMIRCGSVPGALTTINFGTEHNVNISFDLLRRYQPDGPLVNSEFYTGWITHWGEPFSKVSADAVEKKLDEMLALGASVNIYLFSGGTNFGFTSGANGINSYNPQITSHDYDAPLTEAGDPTDKYFQIRNVISKYLPLTNTFIPKISPKGDYGPVLLEPVLELFEPLSRALFGSPVLYLSDLHTFEQIGLPHWLVLYETYLPSNVSKHTTIKATTHDRAMVYVDGILAGVLCRTKNTASVNSTFLLHSKRLNILVENEGHLNYGDNLRDFKGIFNVTIDGNHLTLWNITGFRLSNLTGLSNLTEKTMINGNLIRGPAFLRSYFNISGQPLDTYLNTNGWGKGTAYVNGKILGRYWPDSGPQNTLYVPATFLHAGKNLLEILELSYLPKERKMRFQKEPDIGFTCTKDKSYQ
ncbi:hypothetical protein M0802_016909, partial [Mischocyttarus mexicanus]